MSDPAYPKTIIVGDYGRGMTLRQYAAIKLKVPDSGINWLDEMIAKKENQKDGLLPDKSSLHDYFAAAAMQVFMAETDGDNDDNPGFPRWEPHEVAELAYEQADFMMEARKARNK